MLQRVGLICGLLFLTVLLSGQVDMRRRIDPTPFAHAPCSVLDNRPCAPTHCSLLDPGPCIPEIDHPYGQDLRLTVQSAPPERDAAKYRKPDRALNSISDLFVALRACWSPPPEGIAREGMEMSVRFSFKRSGEMIAAPRVTFATPGVHADMRANYLNAIVSSLDSCLPLQFTDGLGGALAGRPIAIRYVDNRALGKGRSR